MLHMHILADYADYETFTEHQLTQYNLVFYEKVWIHNFISQMRCILIGQSIGVINIKWKTQKIPHCPNSSKIKYQNRRERQNR